MAEPSWMEQDPDLPDWMEEDAPAPDETSVASTPYGPEPRPTRPPPALHQPDAGESFVQGAANAFGTGDLIGAVLQAGLSETTDLPDLLTGKMGLKELQARRNAVFQSARQDNLQRTQAAMREHPVATIAGRMLPSLALAPVTGAATAFGANVGTGALTGAAEGAAQSKGDGLDIAADAATGAAYGAAGGAAGYGAGKYVIAPAVKAVSRKAGDLLEQLAQARALKAATGQNKKLINAMVERGLMDADTGTIEAVGSDLLERRVVTAGASTEDIMQRALAQKEEAGEAIARSLRELDAMIPETERISAEALATTADAGIIAPLRAGTAGQQQVAERIAAEVDALRAKGTSVSLEELEAFKRGLDDSIDWAKVNAPPAMSRLRQFRTLINDAIERKAQEVSAANGSNAGAMYIAAKRVFGSMKTAQDAARNQVAAQQSNRLVSPSDYGTGLTGMVLGSLASGGDPGATALTGAGLGLANHLLRTRGNQVAAAGARTLARGAEGIASTATDTMAGRAGGFGASASPALRRANENRAPSDSELVEGLTSSNPEALGPYAQTLQQAQAEGRLSVVHYVLQQRDPEYRQLLEQAREARR